MATAKRIVKWLPAKYLFFFWGGGLNVYSTYRTHPSYFYCTVYNQHGKYRHHNKIKILYKNIFEIHFVKRLVKIFVLH
jgi:hypothetical protein